MLFELLEYFVTPCEPVFRKLGYLKELIAIEARFRRVGQHWGLHQARTRDFILEAIRSHEYKQKAVVLGAGLLFDIPLQALSEGFKEVVLVDVAFSRKVRSQVSKYTNVYMLSHDISGLAINLLRGSKQEPLPEPQPSLPFLTNNGDLLLSINILSQLPLIPMGYARKYITNDEVLLGAWASRIIRSHIDWLQSREMDVILVSDVEHRVIDVNNKVVDKYDCLYGNTLPPARQSWCWEYAPLGELVKEYSLNAQVEAHIFENTVSCC